MNEQLVVKNFGPIKDATVDFKRVTVFIGPTGGGKSTLAKLAAVFKEDSYNFYVNPEHHTDAEGQKHKLFSDFSLTNFIHSSSEATFAKEESIRGIDFIKGFVVGAHSFSQHKTNGELLAEAVRDMTEAKSNLDEFSKSEKQSDADSFKNQIDKLINDAKIKIGVISRMTKQGLYDVRPQFFPANRVLLPTVEYSWAGFLRDDIGLPKDILRFANNFSLSRKEVPELDIPFLNVKYLHRNGQDFIKVPGLETLFRLFETASGIQSVTPLLVLLEHLSRNTEQAQSFIIEEPELNLYPTAQQGLLNWLVEKCTKGENDLTITTHSPYILSHLNLLLYAFQVAEQHPDRREEVAAIVPEASWINPKEFACYQVENGGVQSLVNDELGMIDNNELDALSGDAADAFDNLIRLSKGIAVK
ncbi:hypothetical protein GCM10022409_14690 [Hymenobacter glaciei]|uniref:ATPase AAA-type core domain-containing protein n=1 Tax=Hymenobacter glaciei TaxID=877209 RepID=A0ABP7TUP1_9BACT